MSNNLESKPSNLPDFVRLEQMVQYPEIEPPEEPNLDNMEKHLAKWVNAVKDIAELTEDNGILLDLIEKLANGLEVFCLRQAQEHPGYQKTFELLVRQINQLAQNVKAEINEILWKQETQDLEVTDAESE